jgi:hypothetical protein
MSINYNKVATMSSEIATVLNRMNKKIPLSISRHGTAIPNLIFAFGSHCDTVCSERVEKPSQCYLDQVAMTGGLFYFKGLR